MAILSDNPSHSAGYKVSVRSLAALTRRGPGGESEQTGAHAHLRRLPPHNRATDRSCPRLALVFRSRPFGILAFEASSLVRETITQQQSHHDERKQAYAPDRQWPADCEIKVNSRRPVLLAICPLDFTMNAPTHDEIHCHVRLSLSQLLAIAVPSGRFIFFAILMFCLWGALVPFMAILSIILGCALLLAALKLSMIAIGLFAYKWSVEIDGDRVTFRHGNHCVACCIMRIDQTDRITLLDPRWTPRRLQIVKTNGEILETLFGVAKSDLTVVENQLQRILHSQNSRPNI